MPELGCVEIIEKNYGGSQLRAPPFNRYSFVLGRANIKKEISFKDVIKDTPIYNPPKGARAFYLGVDVHTNYISVAVSSVLNSGDAVNLEYLGTFPIINIENAINYIRAISQHYSPMRGGFIDPMYDDFMEVLDKRGCHQFQSYRKSQMHIDDYSRSIIDHFIYDRPLNSRNHGQMGREESEREAIKMGVFSAILAVRQPSILNSRPSLQEGISS